MNTENDRITVTFYTGKENCFQVSDMALKAMGNPTYAQVLINRTERSRATGLLSACPAS